MRRRTFAVGPAALLALLRAGPAAGQSAVQGSWEALQDREGRELRAYVAGPGDARAAVLLVHDYFGISDFTRASVERLAAQGYRALAVDLYNGKTATTHEQAAALMQAYMQQERRVGDAALQAGIDALKRPGRRLATLGFSMGGAEALRAALNEPGAVQGSVVAYGFGFDSWPCEQLSGMWGPVLTITGALDEGALQASIRLLKHKCQAGPAVELYVLPGVGHAFEQPLFNGGRGYDPGASEAMWQVIDGFLSRQLRLTKQTK